MKHIVIPARFASTRLSGKPLLKIHGREMILRVVDQAKKVEGFDDLCVVTDDQRIYDLCMAEGVDVVLTSADHPSGTDRLSEVAKIKGWASEDIIVNVQGDEPLIEPALIDELVAQFVADKNLQMATVATELEDADEMNNPNNVKVVLGKNNDALYFSRSLIPYPRNAGKSKIFKHIGIYAYRRNFLLTYAKMEPTPLEQSESLEQLRALENGFKIRVIKSSCRFVGVDTEEDLKLVNEIYRREEIS